MNDLFGRKIYLNDDVIFTYRQTSALVIGRVVDVTDKSCRVMCSDGTIKRVNENDNAIIRYKLGNNLWRKSEDVLPKQSGRYLCCSYNGSVRICSFNANTKLFNSNLKQHYWCDIPTIPAEIVMNKMFNKEISR